MKAAIQAMYKHTRMLQAAESITQPSSKSPRHTKENSDNSPKTQQPIQVMEESIHMLYSFQPHLVGASNSFRA